MSIQDACSPEEHELIDEYYGRSCRVCGNSAQALSDWLSQDFDAKELTVEKPPNDYVEDEHTWTTSTSN